MYLGKYILPYPYEDEKYPIASFFIVFPVSKIHW